MIGVGDIAQAVRCPSGAGTALWAGLVRRGSVFSECESVEWWELPAGHRLVVRPDDGVDEAVVVLGGRARWDDGGTASATAGTGQVLLVPHGCTGTVTAERDSTTVLTVRAFPDAISADLPPSLPEPVP